MRKEILGPYTPLDDAGEPSGSPLRRLTIGFLAGFAVWLLLTGSLHTQQLAAGVVVCALVSVLALPQLRLTDGLILAPALPVHLALFAIEFLLALLAANLDMARRVLAPRLPIDPGVVEVPTGLRSDLGRLLLANSITLTPGTLTVDVEGDRLLVHWVDVGAAEDLSERSHAIAERFERRLRRFVR